MAPAVAEHSDIRRIFKRTWDESKLPSRHLSIALAALIYLRWIDFQDAELEAIAAFDDAEYEPVLPAGLHWRTWYALPPEQLHGFFGEQLWPTLQRLKNHRTNNLATHLHRIAPAVKDLAGLEPSHLESIIRWLADQPFETPNDRRKLLDVFDATFESIHDKYTNDFRTPDAIIRLIVELAAPVAGDRIYDPCFGSAGLLTCACDYVLKKGKDKLSRLGGPPLSVYGVELNPDAYLIGLTRLALAGIDNPQLELANSLERTGANNPQQDGFDVVLADPPWGMRSDPADLNHFSVKTPDVAGLFIQHALSQLRPTGRVVIVVPQGVLFRTGPEQRLRRWLLDQYGVESVVALPENSFLPYRGIRASLLLLRRNGPTKRIYMADAEPIFVMGKGRQPTTLLEDKALEFVQSLHSGKTDENAWVVDVETLAKSDHDFTPRRRDESELNGVLGSFGPSITVDRLKDCCKIFAGRHFLQADLLDIPDWSKYEQRDYERQSKYSFGPIPYIRIKDIVKGEASKGSAWLPGDKKIFAGSEQKLKLGDVLLSKSGRIGKAGIVRNGAVGGVASSGFFVLRPVQDRLAPHFLAAYLNSNQCKKWLGERSRGTSIQILSKHILEELPVPLPPLQIQHRVATESRERDGDALTLLSQILTQAEKDPIAEWVDEKLNSLPDSTEELSHLMDLTPLDHLAFEAKSVYEDYYNRIDEEFRESVLGAWIETFQKVTAPLKGVQHIPPGPGLLSLLQQCVHGLEQAKKALNGDLQDEVKANKLTDLIKDWLSKVCMNMLREAKLVFSIVSSVFFSGEEGELVLKIENASPLPLREIFVFTEPDWGDAQYDYLAEDSSEELNLHGYVLEKIGTSQIKLLWQARTLDDQLVHGSREISFEVLPRDGSEMVSFAEFGGSPYVCGPEIRPERDDVFFGREGLIEQIRRQVVDSGNVILLAGNRRSGKSSILRHLEGIKPIPGWIGIYCSLHGSPGDRRLAGISSVEIFRNIAANIAKGLVCLGIEIPLPNGKSLPAGKKDGIRKASQEGIRDKAPFDDFLDYVEIVLDATESFDLGFLIMLDEFDKLQEGIDNGITSPQVPENIRFLVMNFPRISAVLTGSRRLKKLREEYQSALFGLGTRFDVKSLPLEAAKRLVTEPVKRHFIYSKEAVERCTSLTNCQPFLLQSLCNRVFDMAAQTKSRSITLDFVEQAADLLCEDNSHFADLWNYAGSDRRRFVLGLVNKETVGPDPLRLPVLLELLSNNGIEVSDETLISDLEFLRELELIELVGGEGGVGYYSLSLPLMGRWIDRQHDFFVLKKRAQMETEDHSV